MRLVIDKYIYYLAIFIVTVLFAGLNFVFFNSLPVGIYSFLFLSIVPGLLLFKIIAGEKPFETEHILYYVGLSIFYLLAVGLGINWLLPLVGIAAPLTFYLLLMGISISVFVLSAVSYFTTKFFEKELQISLGSYKDYLFLLPLLLILLLSCMGAVSLNNNGSNIFTLIMLLCTALYSGYIMFFKKDWKDWKYAISIFMIGLSILLMFSLRSWHITGWDVNEEFEVFQVTKTFAHWSILNIRHDYNNCLSITLLPTMLSRFLFINDEYIYKVIFQIYFALVPPALYFLFRKLTNRKFAFIAAFYFIAQPFLNEMHALIRQETAFVFFSLFLLTLYSSLSTIKKDLLLIIFGLSMIVSHYSTAYIALAYLICTYVLVTGINLVRKRQCINRRISLRIILILCLATVLWYRVVNTASNNIFTVMSDSMQSISKNFHDDFSKGDIIQSISLFYSHTNYTTQQEVNTFLYPPGMTYDPKVNYAKTSYKSYTPVPMQEKVVSPLVNASVSTIVTKFLDIVKLITKLFIFLGSFYFIIKLFRSKSNIKEFSVVALTCIITILLFMAIPELSEKYSLDRLYMQGLMVLSLTGILGGFLFLQLIAKTSTKALGRIARFQTVPGIANRKVSFATSPKKYSFIVLATIILVYFLYLSGFFVQIFGGQAVMQLNNFGEDYEKYYTYSQEVDAVRWLTTNRDKSLKIFSDEVSNLRLFSYGLINNGIITVSPAAITRNSYVFVRYQNLHRGRTDATYNNQHFIFFSYPIDFLNQNKDLIYNNGGSEIFH